MRTDEELRDLVRKWDGEVPASDHATTLVLILGNIRVRLRELEAPDAPQPDLIHELANACYGAIEALSAQPQNSVTVMAIRLLRHALEKCPKAIGSDEGSLTTHEEGIAHG